MVKMSMQRVSSFENIVKERIPFLSLRIFIPDSVYIAFYLAMFLQGFATRTVVTKRIALEEPLSVNSKPSFCCFS